MSHSCFFAVFMVTIEVDFFDGFGTFPPDAIHAGDSGCDDAGFLRSGPGSSDSSAMFFEAVWSFLMALPVEIHCAAIAGLAAELFFQEADHGAARGVADVEVAFAGVVPVIPEVAGGFFNGKEDASMEKFSLRN